MNNDVCLLKLERPVSFYSHPKVRPICLPASQSDLYENKIAAGKQTISAERGKVNTRKQVHLWIEVLIGLNIWSF